MAQLGDLSQQILGCSKCGLFKSRSRVVPGEGNEKAAVMFVGEAPGWHEDQQGRPFVGPAGKFLDELLGSIGWHRDQVYITNVIKCRPPGNRDPLPGEIQVCRAWLDQQLAAIQPKVVVTLGRYSLGLFLPGASIGKVHGKAQRRDNVIYFAMYHPAAALHQQSLRQTIEMDMVKLPGLLSQTEDVAPAEVEPEQLSLF